VHAALIARLASQQSALETPLLLHQLRQLLVGHVAAFLSTVNDGHIIMILLECVESALTICLWHCGVRSVTTRLLHEYFVGGDALQQTSQIFVDNLCKPRQLYEFITCMNCYKPA
jgi:hypothetical protein